MTQYFPKAYFLFFISALFSCDDLIYPELADAPEYLVIDAWITDQSSPQVITITRSLPYDSNLAPKTESGAEIFIVENGTLRYDFIEEQPGRYVWRPENDENFGVIGNNYVLSVNNKSISYSAESFMNRVPPVDSVGFVNRAAGAGYREGYWGEFYSQDLRGSGDTYWIKAFKNGNFLNKPTEINLAYDGGPSQADKWDNLIFISVIRNAINPADPDPQDDNFYLAPYSFGDNLKVETHSITNQTFNYLRALKEQTDRSGGVEEIFSTPLSNLHTNIRSSNDEETVLGFFSVSAVSGNSLTLESVEPAGVLDDR